MVEQQLRARGINDPRILNAFEQIPRELFVPKDHQSQAYEDHPISIDCGQTISQPYIVALMLSELHLKGNERVLEIGTGSGYQTALLASLSREVISIERIAALSCAAALRLQALELGNVQLEVADGSLGWPSRAPYGGIIVSAGAERIPQPLMDQMSMGGRMVLPVGSLLDQTLVVLERTPDGIKEFQLGACLFVPLVGKYGRATLAR